MKAAALHSSFSCCMRSRTTVAEARVSRSRPDRGLVRTRIELLGPGGAPVLTLTAMYLILEGAVAFRSPEGRFVREPHAWLYVFVDGLLYRSEMFDSSNAAQAAYRKHGLGLGV